MEAKKSDLLSRRIRSHPTVRRQAREIGVDLVLSEAVGFATFFQTKVGPVCHWGELPLGWAGSIP